MDSSAIPSSSPVVMPGRTAERSSASVRETTLPACFMASNCSEVFSSIVPSSSPWACMEGDFLRGLAGELPAEGTCSARGGGPVDRGDRPLGDDLDRAGGVDRGQHALLAV